MAKARPGRLTLVLVLGLGCAAALISLYVWAHRRELIVIPWLWREALELDALRASDPENTAFLPSQEHELSPFDVVLSRLIRLQRTGFLGGKGFRLLPFRGEEGRRGYLATYEPLSLPFDIPRPPDEPVFHMLDGCEALSILALDGFGRVRGEAFETRVPSQDSVRVVEEGEPYSNLRVEARPGCPECLPSWPAFELFTVDQSGLVHRGRVAAGDLAAPLCPRWRDRSRRATSTAEVLSLLGSPSLSDHHRGLSLLDGVGLEGARLAEPLLSHRDPYLRSRAAAIAGQDPSFAYRIAPLLADPDPRVRFAATEGVISLPHWEALILTLARDSSPVVARRAHRELIHSRDLDVARPSVVALLRARDRYVVDWNLSPAITREAVQAIVEWLEEEEDESGHGVADYLATQLLFSPPELVRPFSARLIRAFVARGQARSLIHLPWVLVRLDDPSADKAVIDLIFGADAEFPPNTALEAFLARGSAIRHDGARDLLERYLRAKGEGEPTDDKTAAALLLVRMGSGEGLRWLLRNYFWRIGDHWPFHDLVYWIQRVAQDSRLDASKALALGLSDLVRTAEVAGDSEGH